MKKLFKKLLTPIFEEVIEARVPRIARLCHIDVTRDLFAYIGIDRLRAILDEAEKSDNRYICLAELYAQISRESLSRQNSEIISNYFNIATKIEPYLKSIDNKLK